MFLIAWFVEAHGQTFFFHPSNYDPSEKPAKHQPNSKMLNAIDTGLTDLFAIARKNNYRNRLNYSDYTIFIAKADRTKNFDKRWSDHSWNRNRLRASRALRQHSETAPRGIGEGHFYSGRGTITDAVTHASTLNIQ